MATTPSTAAADLARCQPAKVLIVEDHAATRNAVSALLAWAFPACQLLIAPSAEGAFALCDVEAPDLVIMDIALPGMNGIEATRHIKARHPGTQVVMHSNSDMQVYQDESMLAGAGAFVSKRRTSLELVPVIIRLFSRGGALA